MLEYFANLSMLIVHLYQAGWYHQGLTLSQMVGNTFGLTHPSER